MTNQKINMLKKNFIIGLFLLFAPSLMAQKVFDNSKNFDIFHNYTRWGIQIDGLGYLPAKIDYPNKFSFDSQLSLGYKFGVVYNISLTNNFGFKAGALLGQAPAINTYFLLDKNEIGTNQNYEHKKGAVYSPFLSNFSFPLLFEYRNFSIDRYILNFDAGIQIQRTGATELTDSYKDYYQTSVANKGNWDFDLILKAGWYYQFTRLMLQTNLVYKHRFVDQYVGTYSFQNLNNSPDINGQYIQTGDYIGLSFDFYFHKRSRDVAMGCRADTQSAKVKKRQRAAQKAKEKKQKNQEKLRKKKAKQMRKKAKKKWIFW